MQALSLIGFLVGGLTLLVGMTSVLVVMANANRLDSEESNVGARIPSCDVGAHDGTTVAIHAPGD